MIFYKEYRKHLADVRGRKNPIDNNIYSFDIETTSYIKLKSKQYQTIEYENFSQKDKDNTEVYSIMYIWMFGVNDVVYYGRTWDEFKDFIKMLDENIPERKIVFIHNLSFEFQFLRGVFDFEDVFARTQRKVIKCKLKDYNIEFRCTYFMTNVSLDKLAQVYNLPVLKLVGHLDYNLIRTPVTLLNDDELSYCENDILVIYHFIRLNLEVYNRVDKIPVTLTGVVRRELMRVVLKSSSYRNQTSRAINIDTHVFNLLQECFMGGYTHANYGYTDLLIKDVNSYDFTSSYPYVMLTYKYPMSKFHKCYVTKIEDMIPQFCYLIVVKFINIKPKYYNTFISKSKCRYIKGGKYDNGRIISADELVMTLTDVDFRFLLDAYYLDYEIIECYYAVYNYLPIEFINFILDKYVKKTELKNVEGEEVEYQRQKSMFNSLYGMTVTSVIKDNVIYDNKDGWSEVKLTNAEIEQKLFKEMRKSFLSFSWGCWVTAWARNNLLRNVLKLDEDTIYCDTDSLKLCKGYDINVINEYNESVKRRIDRVSKILEIDKSRFSPLDIKGKEHTIGLFENETGEGRKYTYDEFITQGAKKYAVRIGDEIKITVAGVPKNKGSKALKNLNEFKDNFIFKSSVTGKQTLIYIDSQDKNWVIDYKGKKYLNRDKTGCCFIPCSYELGKALDYADLLSENTSARSIYNEEFIEEVKK